MDLSVFLFSFSAEDTIDEERLTDSSGLLKSNCLSSIRFLINMKPKLLPSAKHDSEVT